MSGLGGNPVIPAAVADLDPNVVTEALARHACNVSDAAQDLGVRPSDLRRLVWANPALQDRAFEAVEGRLDLAEKNISEALHSDDPRMRVAASMFTLRNSVRAKRRGWITSAVAATDVSVTVGLKPPRETAYVWRNPGEDKREEVERLTAEGKKVVQISWSESDVIERDGRRIPVPRYGVDGRDESDCLEGEVATPATMIEHAAAVEPEPAAIEASEPDPPPAPSPPPESPADRYRREQVAWWIRARLPPCPMDRCAHCRGPFVAGQALQEAANDEVRVRFHAACHETWLREREVAARAALGLDR